MTPTQTNDANANASRPAFKGSEFTADEYAEVWGDDWHCLFMQLTHEPTKHGTDLLPYSAHLQ